MDGKKREFIIECFLGLLSCVKEYSSVLGHDDLTPDKLALAI